VPSSSLRVVYGALPAISITGTRARQRLCSAIAEFAVPASTWTITPCPRPVAIA